MGVGVEEEWGDRAEAVRPAGRDDEFLLAELAAQHAERLAAGAPLGMQADTPSDVSQEPYCRASRPSRLSDTAAQKNSGDWPEKDQSPETGIIQQVAIVVLGAAAGVAVYVFM